MKCVASEYTRLTLAVVSTINEAMAAAGPSSPASSKFKIETDAGRVSVEYRNTSADTVVMALINR